MLASNGLDTPLGAIAQQQMAQSTSRTSDRDIFGSDFESFLTLLTTQLQNQDPMSPMDTHAFTSQLVEFAQVEQSIKSNEQLEALIDLQRGSKIHTAAAMTGKMAEVTSNRTAFDPDTGPIRFVADVPGSVRATTVEIVNEANQVVRSFAGPSDPGRTELSWQGLTNSGSTAPAGIYTVRIIGDAGPDQATTNVPVNTIGRVDGALVEDGEVRLEIGGGYVPLDQLKSIRAG